jgi:hypothetical protein
MEVMQKLKFLHVTLFIWSRLNPSMVTNLRFSISLTFDMGMIYFFEAFVN